MATPINPASQGGASDANPGKKEYNALIALWAADGCPDLVQEEVAFALSVQRFTAMAEQGKRIGVSLRTLIQALSEVAAYYTADFLALPIHRDLEAARATLDKMTAAAAALGRAQYARDTTPPGQPSPVDAVTAAKREAGL